MDAKSQRWDNIILSFGRGGLSDLVCIITPLTFSLFSKGGCCLLLEGRCNAVTLFLRSHFALAVMTNIEMTTNQSASHHCHFPKSPLGG
jgi:hypothetical protein